MEPYFMRTVEFTTGESEVIMYEKLRYHQGIWWRQTEPNGAWFPITDIGTLSEELLRAKQEVIELRQELYMTSDSFNEACDALSDLKRRIQEVIEE